ncbi:hypothetical protein [Acuticoccus sp. I52.16.1]|uniref:hypothetical protein n=1 Tax=Acuticoccus sp. I52.16.1 TaxID=2928472 RepID=UPI001FD5A725|nr:hypothetical protein [Acuticoccus sp. I52.16.1]UOM32862.1 hypothetical protein MRB58_13365 [Acuticoccus sp. I52.16.1]
MIKVQQVGALTPPLLKMIQSGGAEPFMEGDGRVFAYHIGASSVGDVIDIVRNHTRGGIIVLDRSTEAFSPEPRSTVGLLEAVPDGCRVVVLCQNHDYVRAARALGDDRLTAVFMHSFLRTMWWTFRRADLDALIARRRPEATPDKLYTCLLNRPRTAKIVVFGWLKARGYLEAGNVSFRGDPAARDAGKYDELVAKARTHFPSFNREIDTALAAEWPYANFAEEERESFIYSVGVPAYDAPVSLVVETEMVQNFERFTEKSLKMFAAGHRGVIAGNSGVLRLLKEVGFTTPGFPGDYDRIRNQDARLRTVLAEFDRYMVMTPAERRDFIDDTWPECLANMRAFTERTEAVMARSFRELEIACERSRWSARPEPDPVPWRRAARSAA